MSGGSTVSRMFAGRGEALAVADRVRGHHLAHEVGGRRYRDDGTRERDRGVTRLSVADTTDRPPAVSSGSLSLASTLNCWGLPGPKIDRESPTAIGGRLARSVMVTWSRPSRDRAVGVGDLVVDGRVAGLGAGDERDGVPRSGRRSERRRGGGDEFQFAVAAVGISVVRNHVDRGDRSDLNRQSVVHDVWGEVRDLGFTNRDDDRRRSPQPTGVRHLVGTAERSRTRRMAGHSEPGCRRSPSP